MKHRILTVVVALGASTLSVPASAQSTMDWPVSVVEAYHRDSGIVRNDADAEIVVFRETVHVDDAAWLRLFFAEIELGAGSRIRVTARGDGEVQELDAAGWRMWRHSTAYFNGDTVELELVAAPGTANRVVLDHVTMQRGGAGPDGLCGICGADDRVPSSEDWAGRLLPAGCSAAVWSEQSCLVTAGHCISGNDVIQFRVPPSGGDCSLRHPPVDDQFPTTNELFTNGGPGNDWAVMSTGENGLGETAFERFGEFRPIAVSMPAIGATLDVWGYGVDDECERSQVQQNSSGTLNGVFTTRITHDVDTTFGNSGSSMLRNGEIVGIATHCGCPQNTATRIDHPLFQAARNSLCGLPCPADVTFDNVVNVFDLLFVVSTWGPCPGCPTDINGDGNVNVFDLLIVLESWGPCP